MKSHSLHRQREPLASEPSIGASPSPEPLLCEKEAARYLSFSHRTLQKWRGRGDGPIFLKTSDRGSIRYRLSDLEEWKISRLRRSTSDDGNA